MPTHFLATPLRKKDRFTNDMSDDNGKKNDDVSDPNNQKNIISPSSIEELLEYFLWKIQPKISADLEAFLASCSKDQQDSVTQYHDPIIGEPSTSTSVAPEVKINEEVDDPYSTLVNYAKMLQDHITVTDNNLMTAINRIRSRFDRLEGKKVHYIDSSTSEPASKQP